MEHDGMSFEEFWAEKGEWYEMRGMTREEFEEFNFRNGFNKGDVIVLYNPEELKEGDVGVYSSDIHKYPIIHRVMSIEENGYIFKGDHNSENDPYIVPKDLLIGKALFRIPYIGWIKIWFAELIGV
jgi:signal peptidase I